MTTDQHLDAWIRSCVLALVEASPPPPELDLCEATRRRLPARSVLIVMLVAALSITAIALGLSAQMSPKASASALVTVRSSAAGAFRGQIPKQALRQGRIVWADVPQYIPVAGAGGAIIGYVRKSDVDGSLPVIGPMNGGTYSPVCGTDGIDVYDSAHTTVIGALYPGIGYVPLGTTPDCSHYVPATTIGAG